MTSHLSYDPRARRNAATRSLRAHVLAVATNTPDAVSVAAVVRLALKLFPAALLFVSVLGV